MRKTEQASLLNFRSPRSFSVGGIGIDTIKQLLQKKYPDHDFRWRDRAIGGAMGLCPEHDDRKPSLSVSYGQNNQPYFHCFGCGFSGNHNTLTGKHKWVDNKKWQEIIKTNERALELANQFKKNLLSDTNKKGAKAYLKFRTGAGNETINKVIERFPIGLVKKGFRSQTDMLFEKTLEKLCRFNDQLVFVYDDGYEHITKFHLRKPFSKNFLTIKLLDGGMFNFHKIKKSSANAVFIVEGEFDAITAAIASNSNLYTFTATGASTNLRKNEIDYILMLNKVPFLALDWDNAGLEAELKFAEQSKKKEQIYVVKKPGYDAKDIDELLRDKQKDEVEHIFKSLDYSNLRDLIDEQEEKRNEEKKKELEGYPENIRKILLNEFGLDDVKKRNAREIMQLNLFPIDFIINGFVAGTTGLLLGAGGIGKSMLAMRLAMCIADTTGKIDFFGLECDKRGKVGYVNVEDLEPIANHRISRIITALQDNVPQQSIESIYNNFEVLYVAGKSFNLMSKKFSSFVYDRNWINKLTKFSEGKRLVIIDTLSRVHKLNANDNGDMTQLLELFEKISDQTGTSFLLLHHISKAAKMNETADSSAARGATALVDNSRFVAQIQNISNDETREIGISKNEKKNYIKLMFSKLNYSQPIEPIYIKNEYGAFTIQTVGEEI